MIVLMGQNLKRWWRGVVVFLLVLVSVTGIPSEATTKEFLINDGQVVYKEIRGRWESYPDDNLEWEVWIHTTMEVTVVNLDADTVRFTKKITWEPRSIYQLIDGEWYWAEDYGLFGFRYRDVEGNTIWSEFVAGHPTHTVTFIRDVSKSTGLRVRAENPMDLYAVDVLATFDIEGVSTYHRELGSSWYFGGPLTHSDLYCENTTSLTLFDSAMGGPVHKFDTVLGRPTVVLVSGIVWAEEIYKQDFYHYDVASGLLLRIDYFRVYPNSFYRNTLDVISQTVLDPLYPSATTETVTVQVPTMVPKTTTEYLKETVTTTVRETTTITREVEGSYIPGFTSLLGLLGLGLILLRRKRRS